MQSVLITTKVESSNPTHGEVYSIHLYVISLSVTLCNKFVSDYVISLSVTLCNKFVSDFMIT
jgi:hypothetical protein